MAGREPATPAEQLLRYEEIFFIYANRKGSARGVQQWSFSPNKHREQVERLTSRGWNIRFSGRYVLEEVMDNAGKAE